MKLGYCARVLVVDDEPVNRKVARVLCTHFGCEVETTSSGAQAVALCAEYVYDLVLMDIHMPGMNGFQAGRAIRSLKGVHGLVPIVAVTADTYVRLDEESKSAGIIAVIEKPLFMDMLFSTLCNVLESRNKWQSETELQPKLLTSNF